MTACSLLRIFQTAGAIILLTSASAGTVCAQSAPANGVLTEFPADAQLLSDKAIDERVRGQVFTGMTATGTAWRAEYKDSGYVFINLASGARDSGTWSVANGQICIKYRGQFPSGCSEVRGSADVLYSKREGAHDVTVMRKP